MELATRKAKDTLRFVKNAGPDGVDALEFTLLQLALYDLHRQRGDIEKFVRNYESEKKTKTSKLYRAIVKTYLKTGKTPALVSKKVRTQYWVDEYERQDGTQVTGHWRTVPDGQSAPPGAKTREHPGDVAQRSQEMRESSRQRSLDADARERWGGYEETRDMFGGGFNWDHPETKVEFTGLDLGGPRTEMSADQRKTYDKVHNAVASETTQDATKAYLNQQSAAEGVKAVANFFANKPGKFQFAWQAMSKFGPFTGARVAYNYYRYGGYDLPMRAEGGKVYTDLNDQVPAPESQVKTREWAVATLRQRLPTYSTYATGSSEPPSEGFIIDRSGNIVAHAVGRGSDFYLPFSMKHLRAMRNQQGVEYVRRRMIGGPTPEDFHIAMSMGADRFTIISNQGEFTVSLRSRAHGIKVEHFQIVDRYQDLMDKGKNGLTFERYRKMLSTMRDEFPLHIGVENIVQNNNQDWRNVHDRITGVDRLLDSLRDLFSIERQERKRSQSDENLSPQQIQNRSREETWRHNRQFLTGLGRNENVYQYISRAYRQQPHRKQELMNELARYYRDKGEDWTTYSQFRQLFGLDQADRDKQPSDMTQRAKPVPPPGPAEGWNEVTTRRVDAAENAPSQKVTINWSDYDYAPQVLSQLGYDASSYRQTQATKRLVDRLEGMTHDELNDLMEGPVSQNEQMLADLNASFRFLD